jgi:hypothetical protein
MIANTRGKNNNGAGSSSSSSKNCCMKVPSIILFKQNNRSLFGRVLQTSDYTHLTITYNADI